MLARMWPVHALPYLLFAPCAMAVAYRYDSAFTAAKVFALEPARPTPAHRHDHGQAKKALQGHLTAGLMAGAAVILADSARRWLAALRSPAPEGAQPA